MPSAFNPWGRVKLRPGRTLGAAGAVAAAAWIIAGAPGVPHSSSASCTFHGTGQIYVCATGSDSNSGTSTSAPLQTLAAGWSAAAAGNTIQVADGDYTTGCALSGTKVSDTTITGSASARIICGLSFPTGAVHAIFNGVTLYQIGTSNGASNVTVQNLAITCSDAAPYTLYPPDNMCNSHIGLTGTNAVSNWTFSNVTVGPTYDSANCGGTNTNVINAPVSNITFNQVTFQDARRPTAANCGGSTQHDENFYIDAAQNTDTNITFSRCAFYNGPASGQIVSGTADGGGPDSTQLMLTSTGGVGTFSGLTIKNCLFYGSGQKGVEGNVSAQFSNGSVIEYSTFPNGGLTPFECSAGNCPSGYTDLTFRGNVDQTGGVCPDSGAGVTGTIHYQYNYWYKSSAGTPTKCGPNDGTPSGAVNTATLYTSPATNDYTLVTGSPLIGFVPTSTGCVSDDLTGMSRPNAAHPTACNAGAYENR